MIGLKSLQVISLRYKKNTLGKWQDATVSFKQNIYAKIIS